MSPGVRVIRFARVADGSRAVAADQVLVAGVLLQEQPAPVGHIVASGQTWRYLTADGAPSGLTSRISRQDLEEQIVRHHFGPAPAAAEEAESHLQLAM